MATILTGVSIERSDIESVWDTPYRQAETKLTSLTLEAQSIIGHKILTVLDESGNAISGAIVEIKDNNGTIQLSESTDSNGNIYAGRIYYLDQPITITITKGGYEQYQIKVNVSENIDWTIGMEPFHIREGMDMSITEDDIISEISEDQLEANISEDELKSEITEDSETASIEEDEINSEVD